ncbi:MAG TPA: fatty acid desaturase [Elusimicrobiota bacterium]|nr:fatty acid desaturase [Elusimicrobiota bacterium]
MSPATGFAAAIQDLGREARAGVGAPDLALLKRLKLGAGAAQGAGRLLLLFAPGPGPWLLGTLCLGYYFAVEAQLNHSIMHGAYAGIPGAGRFTPSGYESLALPFQSRTWGDAHRLHHASPSLLDLDPDALHPLFRVHHSQEWRPWHRFNAFLGGLFTFELWAFDYDRFLKRTGHRPRDDRGELSKLALYAGWQYVFFAALAGARWKQMLLATLAASIVRNLIFTGLQTGSSVGRDVSTLHPLDASPKRMDAWYRFQAETSKNFALHGIWRVLCGGLDRHIEHHLYPNLPPNRLHALSPAIRELCRAQGVGYSEYPSFWASLGDSLSYLEGLSAPPRSYPGGGGRYARLPVGPAAGDRRARAAPES